MSTSSLAYQKVNKIQDAHQERQDNNVKNIANHSKEKKKNRIESLLAQVCYYVHTEPAQGLIYQLV